jgi:hypothetical protein
MAIKRKALSKQVRFEVFKRDKFTCQYCGRMAPEIVLNCDHITPVAKGGTNEFVNLVTSCEACNSGKSDRALSESDAVKRQAAELLKLAERREQLQMMAEWRTELGKLDEEIMRFLCESWEKAFGYWPENAQTSIRKLAKSRPMAEVIACIEKTAVMYSRKGEDECAELLLKVQRYMQEDARCPGSSRIAFIIGILKNKNTNRCHFNPVGEMLRELISDRGFDVEIAVRKAKASGSGWQFVEWLRSVYGGIESGF